MMRQLVSCEAPYAAATVRSGSFCSITRCTTVASVQQEYRIWGVLALVPVCQPSEDGCFICFIVSEHVLYLEIECARRRKEEGEKW